MTYLSHTGDAIKAADDTATQGTRAWTITVYGLFSPEYSNLSIRRVTVLSRRISL